MPPFAIRWQLNNRISKYATILIPKFTSRSPMKRTITIADSAKKSEEGGQASFSTGDSPSGDLDTSNQSARSDEEMKSEKPTVNTNLRPKSDHQPTLPMKRNILTLASLLVLPILTLADDKKKDADNTGRNERDRNNKTLTPGDQSGKPEDRKLTQAIRQAVMKDKSLTMTAKNVKIITAEGKVTLRGPVNNAEEKAKINDLAKAAAGEIPVDNQLEVKAAK